MKFLRKSVTVEPDTRNVLSKKGICGNRIPLKVRYDMIEKVILNPLSSGGSGFFLKQEDKSLFP